MPVMNPDRLSLYETQRALSTLKSLGMSLGPIIINKVGLKDSDQQTVQDIGRELGLPTRTILFSASEPVGIEAGQHRHVAREPRPAGVALARQDEQGEPVVVKVDLATPPARVVEQGEVLQHPRFGAGERGETPAVLEHAAPVVDAVHAGRVQPVLIQDPGQEIDEHPASLPGPLPRVKGLRYSRLRPRGPTP